MVDNFMRHYCADCAPYGENIQRMVKGKIDCFKSNNKYYEAEHVFKMVESLYKNDNGNMKISFKNNFNYSKDMIGTPIIKNDTPVGYITDVDENEVIGLIWDRYMPIITNLLENKVSSFEIVY